MLGNKQMVWLFFLKEEDDNMNGHSRHRHPNESEYEEIGPPKHRNGEFIWSINISYKYSYLSYPLDRGDTAAAAARAEELQFLS
jgi:hypothetical protein